MASKRERTALIWLASMSFAGLSGAQTQAAGQPANEESPQLAEITVTATRQAEKLSQVPISISAYSQAQMDSQGVKSIDDVIRLTPGININHTGNNQNNIAIRGISSPAGAATTGIYIDDVPIQARNLGYAAGTTYPVAFDLERVEILRGPQGTLFGAGSEGGTVRFIQPAPSVTNYSAYSRAEYLSVENGGTGYEIGGAVGGPIVSDRLGFRLSVFHRRDAGWVDAVTGTFKNIDPTGNSLGQSVSFTPTGIADENTNWKDASAARLALLFAPTDSVKITPSIFYQRQYAHDVIDRYWVSLSDPANGDFRIPRFVAGPAAATHLAMSAPRAQPSLDRFYLPSLNIEVNLPGLTFISTTSYFDREIDQTVDHTQLYTELLHRGVPSPGDRGITHLDDRQNILTQEVRLQSSDREARLSWVVGGFYSHNNQASIQSESQNFTYYAPFIYGGVTDGPPFGPGTPAYINALGVPPLANGTSYYADFRTREIQVAGFGQLDFKVTEKLKAIMGLRYAHNKIDSSVVYDGPEQNINGPYGGCPDSNPFDPATGACSPYIAPGTGVFTPFYGGGSASNSEHAVTPRFGATYQATPDDLYYATISKGFRPAGAQPRLTTGCNQDLIANGFVDANGNAISPTTYKSDSVWSYEIGAKNRLFDGLLSIDGSAYWIKWTDIQGNINLPGCASVITANLGKATSRGFDLATQVRPINDLTFGLSVGYNKTTFDQTRATSSGSVVFSKGSAVPGSGAPWTIVLDGEYDFKVNDSDYYLRGDFTYTSAFARSGVTDPQAAVYDFLDLPQQSARLLNSRAGKRFGDADVSIFMNNVFNSQPDLDFSRTGVGRVLFTDRTFQPRTVGVTASFRF
jgi:outer membrane receptor protein involved in Fe transport